MTRRDDLYGYGSSLHVGLDRTDPDHYAGLKALRSAEHDARAMATLAESQGFEPTAMLLGQEATLEAVRDEIANAVSVLNPGDTFLFTFAGHGGVLPAADHGRSRGVDRTMCLYDQQLIEPLLMADLARFQDGVRVIIVTDSCPCVASMTVGPDAPTRRLPRPGDDEAGDVRAMPADLALLIYRAHRPTYDAWYGAVRERSRPTFAVPVLAMHACQDRQEAREGPMHGRFTGALLRAWNDGAYLHTDRPSYRDLLDQVTILIADSRQVPELSTVACDDQRLAYRPPFVLGG